MKGKAGTDIGVYVRKGSAVRALFYQTPGTVTPENPNLCGGPVLWGGSGPRWGQGLATAATCGSNSRVLRPCCTPPPPPRRSRRRYFPPLRMSIDGVLQDHYRHQSSLWRSEVPVAP